jgi:hypothetical protein
MTVAKYKLYRTTDKTVNLNLDSIKTVLDQLTTNEPITLIKISLTAGLNLVPHTLNRQLTGWSATRIRAQMYLWDSQDNATIATLPNIYLYLNASAPGVIDLEVF